MAAQIHFTVSDEVYSDVFEVARELGLSVSQYARIIFLANRYMSPERFHTAQLEDLDRRERERRTRDDARKNSGRTVRRVDGGGRVQWK